MSGQSLGSGELYTLATVYQICCNDAMTSYTSGKKAKLHPQELQSMGAELETCVTKVSGGISNDCKEGYAALQQCMRSNPRGFTRCAAIRDSLEKCAVKSGLGELGA